MKHFRKIWDNEKDRWLMEHKEMNRKEAYKLFLKSFSDVSDITDRAFYNERSRIGAVAVHNTRRSTRAKPLYSEQTKKGYVKIKVAQPNVWKTKSRWVYEETHPWEDFSERSNYIFLDGNNRNFNPNNIERVPLKLMGIFNRLGGCAKGNPEVTRLRILQAKLKAAQFDAGEKLGDVVRYGHGRVFRSKKAELSRKRYAILAHTQKFKEHRREYFRKMKAENPEKYAEILRKNRERKRAKKEAEK